MRHDRSFRTSPRQLASRVLILLLVLLGLTGPAIAQPSETERAILQMSVNGIERGEVVVVLRSPDVLVRVVDLERAGLIGFGGRRETVGSDVYVSLISLTPAVTYELDERALALRLTAVPSSLTTTIQDFLQSRPPGLVYTQDPSAFINTSMTGIDFDRFTWTGEGGLSIRNTLLYGTAFRDETGVFSRGITSFTVDDRDRLVRWLVGDRFDSTGPLGGSALVGGFSVSREFTLDPYFVRFPTVGLSGAVLTRSVAEVYVNGQLLRREFLPPGPFELRNLPAPVGSGTAEVILRDAFGRQQVISSPFYFTSSLLRAGVQEWSYDVGFRREQQVTGLGEYGPWAVLGRHRVGVTDDLTVGARVEGGADLVSGGPIVTLRLPVGEVELTVAGSRSDTEDGWAGSLAYNYASRLFSVGWALRTFSEHYVTTSLKAPEDRPRLEATALVGFPITTRSTVTLQYTHTDFRDAGPQERVSASVSARLTGRASLFVTASHARQPQQKPDTSVFTGLTYFLGDSTTATASHEVSRHQHTAAVEAQRSLPLGTGLGYRLRAVRAEQDLPQEEGRSGGSTVDYQGLADLQYQSQYGFYEGTYERINGRNSSTLTAAAGIVAIGGSVHLSRPVQDGYALVNVPGVAGVRASLNNQEVGRTDSRGRLLVPNLLPYYGNRLGISDQDIPIDYSIAVTDRLVAPPVKGGSVVTFPARRVQAFVGAVVVETAGRTVTPAYGQLTVTAEGQTYESPIGRDGEFYLENLPRGRHAAVVDHKDAVCRFTLEAPASAASLVDVGTVHCVVP
ncbi:MAG TPA: fimbria/pilus outer membrane usher protein [Verrucomicrobiae bacterium]|nr:fimbria/pilus outer membrane usher protein [Verrucomicrobiae bacterium]